MAKKYQKSDHKKFGGVKEYLHAKKYVIHALSSVEALNW